MSGANDVVLYQELAAQNGKKIGVATLNSEKSLNALSLPMVESLLPQLQTWQTDNSISMVLLQGAGDKAFCAGGDIRDLPVTQAQAAVDHLVPQHKAGIGQNGFSHILLPVIAGWGLSGVNDVHPSHPCDRTRIGLRA